MAYPSDWETLSKAFKRQAAGQWSTRDQRIGSRRRPPRDVGGHGIPGGNNRWFPSREQARNAALQAATARGAGYRIVWDDAHQPGQQPHYHVLAPDGSRVSGHFFYGTRPTRRVYSGRPNKESEFEAGDLRAALQHELHEYEGQYEIIGADTRVLVTNTTTVPFRYIVNIANSSGSFCSGTLIGPSTVLTAGHCIQGETVSDLFVVPGRNGLSEPFGRAQAQSVSFAPGFAAGTATDYGVIQLSTPIGNSVGFWGIAFRRGAGDTTGTSISADPLPLKEGTLQVNLSGYPADKCLPTGQCGTQQWRAFDRTVKSEAGQLHYLNDTFGGHSGSPVWVRRSPDLGGRVMVGIHIRGAGGTNAAVRITPGVLANIVGWLAAAPTPTPPSTNKPTLRRGSSGPAVVEAQTRLNAWIVGSPGSGQALLTADGMFGPKTDAATRAFQKANGLVADGVIGPKTWAALPPLA